MSFDNDMNLAALEFDVKAALDTLQMFAEADKPRIRVQELLQQCMGKIDNWQEKYVRLEELTSNHELSNYTEFANWMGVSRQTVNNWKANGYILLRDKKVDLKQTFKFWMELKLLLRW